MRDVTGTTASRWSRPSVTVVLAAALYAAVGLLTLSLAAYVGLAAPLWPAAGIAFALVYQRGRVVAVGVLVGSLAVNVSTLLGKDVATTEALLTAGLIAVGAAVQALVGSELVTRRLGRHVSLTRAGQIALFLALAGPVACVVNATVGVSAQLLTGVLPTSGAVVGWITWWAGDSIGVLVFAPVTLMLMAGQADVWAGRRWKVAAPSLLVTLLLLVAFMTNRNLERQRLEARENQITGEAAVLLENALALQNEVLHGITGFVASSNFVEADEFRTFTSPALERYPAVQGLAWDSYVPRAELASYLSSQQDQPGRTDYRVTELDDSGTVVPSGARDAYVIVTYAEPASRNNPALGLDLLSDPVRAAAVRRAAETGEITSTGAIDLVQVPGREAGILTLAPLYAGGVAPPPGQRSLDGVVGFASGVYRVDQLVDETYAQAGWSKALVVVTDTTDSTGTAAPVELARTETPLTDAAGTTRTTSLPVNGRTWTLAVTPTAASLTDVRARNVPAALVAAVLVLGLLELFLLLVTGLERQARRDAEESSYAAEHDPLTDLYNRRGFRRALRAARDRTVSDGQHHVLMVLDLDGFKAVNDRGGHDAGDALLQLIAASMQRLVRRRDIVARTGGDEFAIVLTDCGVERALTIAHEILVAVSGLSVRAGDQDLSVRVSIGAVPVVGPEPPPADELVTLADRACFAAKRSGGSVVLDDITVAQV